MPLHHAIWTFGGDPKPLVRAALPSEAALEDMIVAAPGILSEAWMLVGRQERTAHGGRIDLLAVAPDGSLILIEVKRDRTPRDVVAQALDYASWVETLRGEDLAAIYARFRPERSLSADFQTRFGQPLDEDALDGRHQIVIVAAELDADSERIVTYLSDRGIAINVLCFDVFEKDGQRLLSRVWLREDAVETVPEAKPGGPVAAEPWNGEFYVSFGARGERSWDEAVRYGFVCGGGDAWFSKTLKMLRPEDRVWVKSPDHGFVGVGRVTGIAMPARDFCLRRENGMEVPALDVLTAGHYHREFVDDPEKSEWFVPVRWLQTVPLEEAVSEVGLFGNQNTVCRPRTPKWRTTVERLKGRFPDFDDSSLLPQSS